MNDNNNNNERIGEQDTIVSRSADAFDIFRNWKALVGLAGVVLASVLVFNYVDITIPEWLLSLLKATALLMLPSWFISSAIVNTLVDDDRVAVVEVDAEREFVIRGHRVPQNVWANREVTEGSVYYTPDNLAIVRKFDWDGSQLKIEAAWMGELNDAQIMTAVQAIKSNRDRHKAYAKIGHNVRVNLPNIVDNVISQYYTKESRSRIDAEFGEDLTDIVRDEIDASVDVDLDTLESPGFDPDDIQSSGGDDTNTDATESAETAQAGENNE